MDIGNIYFWTATIYKWQRLLMPDENRDIVIRSLNAMVDSGHIEVFGYVIMPNHVHIIWRILKMNGSEKPNASFLKHTAHELRKYLVAKDFLTQSNYMVDEGDRQMRIWHRDSLAVLLDNPLQKHWKLANRSSDYKYSSAAFYYRKEANILKLRNLRQVFG